MISSHNHLPHPEVPTYIEQLKLDLGEDIKQLIDSIASSEFESTSASYIFNDSQDLKKTWCPADIAFFVMKSGADIKSIRVSYDSDVESSEYRCGIELKLTDGERVLCTKDPDDAESSGFNVQFSTDHTDSYRISDAEALYMISSVALSEDTRPNFSESALLSDEAGNINRNPTDPLLAHYIQTILSGRADEWQHQKSATRHIDDDRNLLIASKTTSSIGTTSYAVSFAQEGSDASSNDRFETTAEVLLYPGESTHKAQVEFTRHWDDGTATDRGFADDQPHIIDYLRAVIASAEPSFDNVPTEITYGIMPDEDGDYSKIIS